MLAQTKNLFFYGTDQSNKFFLKAYFYDFNDKLLSWNTFFLKGDKLVQFEMQ